jgi:hypothetical protein
MKTEGEIDGDICPHYYWCQVQTQLECCDLEVCDFWQCEIIEYKNRKDWLTDDCTDCVNTEEQNSPKYIPEYAKKGCIIQLIPKDDVTKTDDNESTDCKLWNAIYIYPDDLRMTCEDYDKWSLNIIYNLKDYDKKLYKNYVFDKLIYWKLKKSHNVAIKRNKQWFKQVLPKLNDLWDKILYYRQHLDKVDDFVAKMKNNISKPLKYNKKVESDEDLFLSDSSNIDTSIENEDIIIPKNDDNSDDEFDDDENSDDDLFLTDSD